MKTIIFILIIGFTFLYINSKEEMSNEMRGCIASAYQSHDVESNLDYCYRHIVY